MTGKEGGRERAFRAGFVVSGAAYGRSMSTLTVLSPPPDTIAAPTTLAALGSFDLAGGPLNPAQQQVLDLLGARGEVPVAYDPSLRHELLAELEGALEPLVAALPDGQPLYLSKFPLSQVHGCEAKFLAGHEEAFEWSVASARGTIAHKAIELSIHWEGEPYPLDLVDEAMARLSLGNGSLAEYLQRSTDIDRAELRGEANERVTKFLECFPPLKPAWRPVTESGVKIELFDRRIVLQGRVDLTLGHARGTTARKVLIDFKSGGFSPSHVDDLRFYALLETIRIGTPPRRLATYYLDAGRPHPETVTIDVLRAAIRRTVDGATRMVELLHHEHPPAKRPGFGCRWCPAVDTCAEGRGWLLDEADGVGTVVVGPAGAR